MCNRMGRRIVLFMMLSFALISCKEKASEIKPTLVTSSGDAITIQGRAIIFSANNYCLGNSDLSPCLSELREATLKAQEFFQDKGVHIECVKTNFVINQSEGGNRSVVNVFESSDCVFVCAENGEIYTISSITDFEAMSKKLK